MSEQAKHVCTYCEQPVDDDRLLWLGQHLTRTACTEALRAALDQERARIRELAQSPPMASISLCCQIVRIGRWDDGAMHSGLCRGRLGGTHYLHDVSALLSGRGEGQS